MRPAISSRVHRGIPLAVVAVAAALVLSGCGTGPADPAPATSTTASTAPSPTATAPGVVVIPIDHCPPVVGPGRAVPLAPRDEVSLLPSSLQVSGALVCRFSHGTGTQGRVEREIRLSTAKAEALATALRAVRFVAATGPAHCPADFGDVTVIGFMSSASRTTPPTTTDVRWETTGCQSIGNGRIRTSQVGNPSFWRFEQVFRALVNGTPRPSGTD